MLVLVVIAVALLAFTVLMIIFYIGAVNKTPQLEDDIMALEVQLATIPEPDIPGLHDQIEDLQYKIDNEAPFPKGPFGADSKYDVKQVTNAIFELAEDSYVSLDSLSHSNPSSIIIGLGKYRTDPYGLRCSVDGVEHSDRLIDLLELLEELREDEYPTLAFDDIKLPGGGINLQFDLAIITQEFEE
jgi:hypothetical protein